MKTANPYLNFPGNTEEAFAFYRSVFGGELIDLMRFRDFEGNPMGLPDHELDRIAHVALPLTAQTMLMATDVLESWDPVTPGNNFYITLETDTKDEAEKLFGSLSDGGRVLMPLQPTLWAEAYGTCVDPFGVQWMIMYSGNATMSAPEA